MKLLNQMFKQSRRFALVFAIALSMVLVFTHWSPAMAQEPYPDDETGDEEISNQAAGWEVGVSTAGGNLQQHAANEGWGLYKKLRSCGWIGRYRYAGWNSWEEEFKRSSRGGKEYRYVDTVDLAFYVGHGSPWSFTFDNPYHDDRWLTPSDCYRSWGNNDNEWVALTSCQVLNYRNMHRWAKCMYGSHLILGFHTNASAHYYYSRSQGYNFAKYLCWGYTVPQAWFKAADRSQPAGRIVRVLGNEPSCFSDRPRYNRSCRDSYDWDWWYAYHYAGSELPRPVNIAALDGTMPVFKVQPLSLADANNKFDQLSQAFDIPASAKSITQQATSGGEETVRASISENSALEMGESSGLYDYLDLDTMWSSEQITETTVEISALSTADIRNIADQFLNDNGLMSSNAQFYEVVSDTITAVEVTSDTVNSNEDGVRILEEEKPMVWQVIYSRILTYTPRTKTNVMAANTITFSVVGPGAKQKVYVDPQTQVTSKQATTSSILGSMGGWRAVQQQTKVNSDGIHVAAEVNILPIETIKTLYEELEAIVTMNPAPIEADQREVLSYTLAYWEEGLGASQSEFIPVYALQVRYTSSTTDTDVTDHAYVPANETYMPPLARIDTEVTGTHKISDVLTLEAADASKTLASLGYDSSLSFVLGSGTEDDYIYEWFIDSVDEANKIGNGSTLTYSIESFPEERQTRLFVLQVTDITNSNKSSNSSLDSVTVEFVNQNFIPIITK